MNATQPQLGDAYKQLGMLRADVAASTSWKQDVDAAIVELAATGEPFTAEEVRELAGDPPDHPNAMGARFNAAARAGLIVRVGYRLARRASLHRHPIALWVGAG